jgi:hypothetical protein
MSQTNKPQRLNAPDRQLAGHSHCLDMPHSAAAAAVALDSAVRHTRPSDKLLLCWESSPCCLLLLWVAVVVVLTVLLEQADTSCRLLLYGELLKV